MPVKQTVEEGSRRMSVLRCTETLVHVLSCTTNHCSEPGCVRMKYLVNHTRHCKIKIEGNCLSCKQLAALCYYHARDCQEDECELPTCNSIKQKIKQHESEKNI